MKNNLPKEGWYVKNTHSINAEPVVEFIGRETFTGSYGYYGLDGKGAVIATDQDWATRYAELTIDEFIELSQPVEEKPINYSPFSMKELGFQLYTPEQVCELLDELASNTIEDVEYNEGRMKLETYKFTSKDLQTFKEIKGLVKSKPPVTYKRKFEAKDYDKAPQTEIERKVDEMYEYFAKHCKK